MAIHQEDVEKKNAVLLAVEHKHPRTYKLLREKYSSYQSIFQNDLYSKLIDDFFTGMKESTPFLIAAKMGVLEIVQGIMRHHPMAIHQKDVDNKNALLLAAEHKHQKTYKLLLNKYSSRHRVVEKVDNNGNTALHLAATLGKKQQWGISSAAIQMQWEIKWYNFIKSSVPTNLLPVRNNEGKTSMEVFEETHEGIIKDGVKWLNSTSESCSVVAALIASVAYASAATVPGGYKGDSGIPILKGDPSFDTFIIASLVALCFSLTSLTMFLSILTTNYTIHDFLHKLPTKLLLGLTTLFISIGAMLVSFCAGHFFNIGDRNRNTGLSVFAIICLPVSAYVLTQFHLLISLVKAPF
ncbi:Ankyrin repeat-containing domain-containing protein [Cinnamomum micranthum f. kanehirae]|uniref:Ankyrin repeat-containing domain-containing protein n=1 Tax=Cinnamomum micranthum f. kanehirae TaxID=337451 RepID=A0A3S3M220_9MAGN|nr:Ankyrin repeat-containing domain-containing protein [Cinnamomum micranthum f. kanehirae]